MNIDELLTLPYVDGGRAPGPVDCWGLALLVRQSMGLPALPSRGGITRQTIRLMQDQYYSVVGHLTAGAPQPGALAAAFRGRCFVHVGVVVEIEGRLAVLETNPGSGVRWLRLPDFEERYLRVTYYHDSNLA